MSHVNPSTDELRAMLRDSDTIAMVGASSNPEHKSNSVMQRLQAAGFRVIPINPHEQTILGEKTYASLKDVQEKIDIVDVFRRPEETPPIADDAVAIHAKVLWLQLDISNEEAAIRADAGGLSVVMDRCIARTVEELGIRKT